MFRAMNLIAGRVRLMHEMRRMHTKFSLPSVPMPIAGEANIDRISVLSQVCWAISSMVANPLSWVRSIDSY